MHRCISGKWDNVFKQEVMMAAKVFSKTEDYKDCIYETSMWGSETTNSQFWDFRSILYEQHFLTK